MSISVQTIKVNSFPKHLFTFVEDALKQIEIALEKEINSDKYSSPIVKHILGNGGKRLRPLLSLICSSFGTAPDSDRILLAVIMELIHSATLLHDDIIDKALIRRGKPTANRKWGEKLTVLVGDNLYCRAIDYLVQQFSREILRKVSNTVLDMTQGEIMQSALNHRLDISREQYFYIITNKTAKLFETCCSTAIQLDKNFLSLEKDLSKFGLNFGTAFQITDDTLDFAADDEILGKKSGKDFMSGTVTLPVIILHDQLSSADQKQLEKIFYADDIKEEQLQWLKDLLSSTGTIKACLEEAKNTMQEAKKALENLPDGPQRIALEFLSDYVIQRNF